MLAVEICEKFSAFSTRYVLVLTVSPWFRLRPYRCSFPARLLRAIGVCVSCGTGAQSVSGAACLPVGVGVSTRRSLNSCLCGHCSIFTPKTHLPLTCLQRRYFFPSPLLCQYLHLFTKKAWSLQNPECVLGCSSLDGDRRNSAVMYPPKQLAHLLAPALTPLLWVPSACRSSLGRFSITFLCFSEGRMDF